MFVIPDLQSPDGKTNRWPYVTFHYSNHSFLGSGITKTKNPEGRGQRGSTENLRWASKVNILIEASTLQWQKYNYF